MTFSKNLITLCFVGLITYVGNYISYLAMMKPNSPPFDPLGAFLGMVVIIALALVVDVLFAASERWITPHGVRARAADRGPSVRTPVLS